jgi:hypothetical protein
VQPLYLKAARVRADEAARKVRDVVPEKGPIPAHLLGNIWAQEWQNVYPLVAPAKADAGYSLDDILKQRKMSALDMVRAGERFYTSLGFDRCPRRSGNDRCSSGRRIARSSATPAPGTSTSSRRAHQDVHRADGRGLHDHPSRAGAQLLSACLQGSSRSSAATAPTTASTRRSATRSRCRSRRSTW